MFVQAAVAPACLVLLPVVLTVTGFAVAQEAGQQPRFTLPPGVNVRRAADQAMSLLSFAVVPNGTASAMQINRSGSDSDSGVLLGQIGAGFTVSASFLLYLEGFIGFVRYDPRFVFTDGQESRRVPTRWNDIATTVGGLLHQAGAESLSSLDHQWNARLCRQRCKSGRLACRL